MCNLYSSARSRTEVARWFQVQLDLGGNLPPQAAIYPDQLAPVIRQRDGSRVMEQLRWGFPPPPNLGNRPVTNVRNLKSSYWRGWLKPEFRCLVPATSFCEYTDSQPKIPHWFATGPEREPFAFAGIWRPWTGARGTKAEVEEGEHLLFSFLTCEPNDVVRPIHAKAMPVMLTQPDEWDAWLSGPVEVALALQRPLPEAQLHVVATGQRKDGLDTAISPLPQP